MLKLTINQFVEKANSIHHNLYTYDRSVYVNSRTKIAITCIKHGDFHQEANAHMSGQGCPKCKSEKISLAQLFPEKEFLHALNKAHPDLKLISRFNGKSKPIVLIDKFGNEFKTIAANSLTKRFPSITCSTNKTKYFIFLANKIHNNLYSYKKSIYRHDKEKLIVTCKIHGDFYPQPSNHLNGSGCPHCKTKGYTKSEWIKFCNKNNYNESTLYLINCFNKDESFLKIGITNKSVKDRFCNKQLMPYNYSILKEIKGSPEYIFRLEKRIHSRFLNQKYIPKIKFSGYTECFN